VHRQEDAGKLELEQLAAWADELRAMAAIGLIYGHDAYDLARYERIQAIADALLGGLSGLTAEAVRTALAAEIGYITVKVGVAAAVIDAAGKLLLVRRRDNRLWAMPGGWADVGDTPAAMTAREVWEETGLRVRVDRLVGLYDSRKRRFGHAHHLYHLVFLCTPESGEPRVTPETLGVDWFSAESLPSLSSGHADAAGDAFRAWADPLVPAVFD
jgi:ADP-ribose pyrophosphatase YjhB (NUDIX family)